MFKQTEKSLYGLSYFKILLFCLIIFRGGWVSNQREDIADSLNTLGWHDIWIDTKTYWQWDFYQGRQTHQGFIALSEVSHKCSSHIAFNLELVDCSKINLLCNPARKDIFKGKIYHIHFWLLKWLVLHVSFNDFGFKNIL